MATKTFEYFLPEVATEVMGCPQPLIIHALRSAAIDLCRRSLAWVYQVPVFLTTTDLAEYDITLPTGVELVMPSRVFINGIPIDPASVDNEDDVGAPVEDIGSGAVTRYSINGDGQLVLLPAPANDTDEVIVRACVCPTRDADDMDAILASTYYIEIASGAIAQLCASPNKPYTNPDVSAYRAAKFEAGVVAAANRKLKGATQKSLYMRPRAFA
jgi:hypothetical protein